MQVFVSRVASLAVLRAYFAATAMRGQSSIYSRATNV
jgi:hypothetical protein